IGRLTLLRPALTIGVERVVDGGFAGELFEVVRVRQSESLSDGFEPTRLRSEVLRLCIGPTDNQRQRRQCRIGEAVLVDDGVEAALGTLMAKLDVWHIERCRALPRRDGHHLASWYVQELGLRVDKALDEPRTGNAVNLRPLTGHPFHG